LNQRTFAIAVALIALGLVFAQLFAPSWAGFHTWQYAGALALCAIALFGYIGSARKGEDGEVGTRLTIAMIGALVAIGAGIASGLLGPDSETVARAPASVAPLPDVGAAAFFPNADAATIARGDARVILRKRDGTSVELAPGAPHFFGTAAVEMRPQIAAYIDVSDLHGNHLTITQPTSASFLSPVLFFPQTLQVAGRNLPADTFATPALHRQIKAFYFSGAATKKSDFHGLIAGDPALLFAVDDDSGDLVPGGIGFVQGNKAIDLGGVRLRASLGTYPTLVISAIPEPAALWLGGLCFLGGLVFAYYPRGSGSGSGSGSGRGRGRDHDHDHDGALAPALVTLVPALALAITSLGLGGCTRVGTTGEGSAQLHAWTTPDTVRIGFYEEPDTLDPVLGEMAFASDIYQLVFDGLIRYDDKGHPIPDLAREVPSQANGGISPDGKTVTYHLVRNARWHDGVPFTAADVIFTWRAILNPNNNIGTRVGYDQIASIDAPDKYTVRLHLRRPYAPAIYLFRDSSQGSIVPAHLLSGYANLNKVGFNTQPVGTGPYVFKGWSHGSEMRFDANPDYFAGKPKIAHVLVRFIPDQNTLLNALRTHEIDVDYGVPPVQVQQIQGFDGIKMAHVSTLHWEHLTFNTRRPPLDDRQVRLALAYATDVNAIYAKIYRSLGTQGPVHFNPDFGWVDPAIHYYPHDVKKAGELLDAAGWKLGPDGIRSKNGVPLAFAISTVAGVKQREAIEVLLQSEWREAGVDLTVKNYPAATLFAPFGAGGMLDTGKTDVSLFTWDNSLPDPDDETYISPNRLPPAGQNVSFYRNADIGTWQQAALRTYDVPTRKALYHKIQHVLIDQVPEYVLDWLPEITAVNVDLNGVRPVPVGSDFWNIASWSFGP
jgi:peptide/nickel transport system substrate-binding protein